MILDSSAVLAILLGEPEGHLLDKAILEAKECSISAASFLEVSMVLFARKGPEALRDLDLLLMHLRISIVPFTEDQARLACEAFKRYGKGFHPAKLNFGDCIAYALCKETGDVLLFKGEDFSRTDVQAAPY